MTDHTPTSAVPLAQDGLGPPLRIAVLDRDSGFLQVLGKRLERLGWEHRVVSTPLPVETVVAMRLSAVVVDLACLGAQGWTWLERLCSELPGLGVVVCTRQSTVAERVRGLRLGADDWVTKPCHPEEVLARLQTALRKRRYAARVEAPLALVAGELDIRPNMFEAFVGGHPVGLTRREFELLQTLGAAGGAVVPRERIYQQVWGYS